MKTFAITLSAVVVAGTLLTGCDSQPSTCAPLALQSIDFPLSPGGGSGGGGGRGSGGSSGSGKSGSGSKPSGGSSGGSYGGSKPSGGTPRAPSAPDRSYRPPAGSPAPTYVRQPDGMWAPFIGGVLAGELLSRPPAGC